MRAIDSSGGRLSPLNIQDPLLRAELFREIRAAQTSPDKLGKEWGYYIVQPADLKSPELIAWKVWGLDALKWLVMAAAGLDDSRGELQGGARLRLPSALWLRERVRFYQGLESGGGGGA